MIEFTCPKYDEKSLFGPYVFACLMRGQVPVEDYADIFFSPVVGLFMHDEVIHPVTQGGIEAEVGGKGDRQKEYFQKIG